MLILQSLLSELKDEFSPSRKNEERSVWFIHTLLVIILPFTSSKTSNLLRRLRILFGFAAKFDILVVSDFWFGNDGLWTPVRQELGGRVQMLSRLRANNNLFGLLEPGMGKGAGRPRKYGDRLGTTSTLASVDRGQA